ncbi:Lrp/AsnC family transcriptional regulator [Novosphingobium profundi]|uniref:Lrp/AsnC family transcriptional regulator n=1 Tax=Novosphingobium profundi TaxID=1774954 RepID=UPI001BD9866D|nr:Lrp/AsnC family transcriptional regulator [Novosphingobium profundi]MBT0670066.1 Lrp/AsnC family transcriptional regulator [Novosphingobium profundi]
MKDKLDSFDRRILEHLQDEGDLGPSELSGRVHLSPSQCSRRLQRLKDDGYIRKTAAILEPQRLNLGISAFIAIRLRSQSVEAERAFHAKVMALDEILSCDYTTGEFDFILKVHTRDLESFSELLSTRLRDDVVENVRSFIIMKGLKQTTALPLEFC